jgi:hypothetical protein
VPQLYDKDPRSTSTAPQCTTDHESPPSSPVPGTSPLMAGVVAPTEDDSPTPREAARWLARFTKETLVMRQPPFISSPPKQKPPPKRALPLRSRRIAAQQMGHIPVSKHGKVLLMKKMRFLEPLAPPSSAAKRSYHSCFKGDLSAADVEALDDLSQLAGGCSVKHLAGLRPWSHRLRA